MADNAKPKKGRKQKTRKGYEIPVPRRGDFYKNLEKAAEPHDGNGKTSDFLDGSKKKSDANCARPRLLHLHRSARS